MKIKDLYQVRGFVDYRQADMPSMCCREPPLDGSNLLGITFVMIANWFSSGLIARNWILVRLEGHKKG